MRVYFSRILLATGIICSISNLNGQGFTEQSLDIGIDHVQFGSKLMGGGIACFDFNADGWIDIYLTGGLDNDKLYKNNGDGTFTNVASEKGIEKPNGVISMGVTTGDIDNDGIREIFISTDQSIANIMYKSSDQGKTYSNVATDIGLTEETWSMGAVFADVNEDGFLDLYVINYLAGIAFDLKEGTNEVIGYNPSCLPDYLYINNGDGTFNNVSGEITEGKFGCGLAVTSTDFDGDGDSDIYIANDFGAWSGYPNALLENNPESAWADIGSQSGTNAAMYGMGIATGDYNNDLILDYYVTNLGRNVLLKNSEGGVCEDVSAFASVENIRVTDRFTTGWGSVFADYDNDTYLDLFVANGHIPTLGAPTANTIEDPNKAYRNGGDGTFVDVSDLVNFNHKGRQRGLTYADLDNDGDLDLIASSVTRDDPPSDRVLVYKNNNATNNNWLKVDLEGSRSNRDAYGAQVLVYANEQAWIREVAGGSSHASQNSSIVHFGLGGHSRVDSLIVKWSSGFDQHFSGIESNQLIKLTEQVEEIYDLASCDNSVIDIKVENFRPQFHYEVRNDAGDVLGEISLPGDSPGLKLTDVQSADGINIVCFPEDRTYESRLRLDKFNPKISRGLGNELVLPEGTAYRWFLNNQLLSETTQIHNANVAGVYHGEVENEYGCIIETQEFTLEEDQILGIPDQTQLSTHIFPNPSNGNFFINFEKLTSRFSYTVLSMAGKKLHQNNYSGDFSDLVKIQLNDLEPGIYFIRIAMKEGSATNRILIK